MKTLTVEAPIYRTKVPRVKFINIKTHPGWLGLPSIGTNLNGHKPVRATEVLLYLHDFPFASVDDVAL